MSTGGFAYDPDAEDLDRARMQAGWLSTEPPPAPGERERDTAEAKLARLLDQAREKMAAGDHHTAIARLHEARKLNPRHAATYLTEAECMLALDQPDSALDLVDTADRYASDRATRDRVADARSRCTRAVAEEHLRRVRAQLRRGEAGRALEMLRRCEHLFRDDRRFQEILSYTQVRAGEEDPADVQWLDVAELERVLRWLTREELEEAERALHDQQYDRALRACVAAARIDRRGALAALLHALALYGQLHVAATADTPPNFTARRTHLVKAARWAKAAAVDPTLKPRRDPLAAAIDRTLAEVDAKLASTRRMAAIQPLYQRFHALVRIYNKQRLNVIEYGNMRSSMAALGTDVTRLRRTLPPDSPEGRALAELAQAIARVQATFR
jgi:tetratricopeptide (TPR) repeat protein